MKICHAEAMKRIKKLEESKANILKTEELSCVTEYVDREDKMPTEYDYFAVNEKIDAIDKEVRMLKFRLAQANVLVKLEEFDITIGEGLVTLAQLSAKKNRLDKLAERRQIARRIGFGGTVEYTECCYDVAKATEDSEATAKLISDLQLAIDRANLNNYLEI